MGAGGAAVVAAVAAQRARRLRDIVDAFRIADATAADRARTLSEVAVPSSSEVETLAAAGILVHDVRSGGWWLNERAFISHRDRHPKRALRLLLVFVAIALVLVAIGLIALTRTAR